MVRIHYSQDGGKTQHIVKRKIGDVLHLHAALSNKYRGSGTVIPSNSWYRGRGQRAALFTENGNFSNYEKQLKPIV